jgi:hypothetical protein
MDASLVGRWLRTGLLFVVTVFLGIYAIRRDDPAVYALLFIIPIAIGFLGRPAALLVLTVAAEAAKLKIPGLPGNLDFHVVLRMLMIVSTFFAASLGGRTTPRKGGWPERALMLFLLNMVMIMMARGFGMRIFGGTVYGGIRYVLLTVTVLFLFASQRIRLGPRQASMLLWGTLAASLIPFVVQVLIYLSDGRLFHLIRYVNVSVDYIEEAIVLDDVSKARWSELGALSRLGVAVSLVFLFRRRFLSALVIVGAMIAAFSTGFRSHVLEIAGVSCLFYVIMSRDRVKAAASVVAMGLATLLVLIVISPHLPPTFQRAISFLPGVTVDAETADRAWQSVEGRLEIWRIAWREMHRYWLIGRGLTAEIAPYAWLRFNAYVTPEFMYLTHAYHSGPLSALVDFGASGAALLAIFFIAACREGWRGLQDVARYRSPILARFHVFILASMIYRVFAFVFVFGTVPTDLARMITYLVILRAIRRMSLEETPPSGSTPSRTPEYSVERRPLTA